MAGGVKLDDLRRNAFNAAYAFRARYQAPVKTAQYWEAVAADMQAVALQHNNDAFLLDLLAICYVDIERAYDAQ